MINDKRVNGLIIRIIIIIIIIIIVFFSVRYDLVPRVFYLSLWGGEIKDPGNEINARQC